MAMAQVETDDGINGINVTPLVDIMLVLLIVFMIATKLDQPGAMDVQLPRASTATEIQPTTLAIVIHKDGRMEANGSPTTLPGVEAAARRAGGDTQATISGDRGVSYERVIAAMDALRRGGLYKLALPTELEDAR